MKITLIIADKLMNAPYLKQLKNGEHYYMLSPDSESDTQQSLLKYIIVSTNKNEALIRLKKEVIKQKNSQKRRLEKDVRELKKQIKQIKQKIEEINQWSLYETQS